MGGGAVGLWGVRCMVRGGLDGFKGKQGAKGEGQESFWLALSEWEERIAGLVPEWEGSPGLLCGYLLAFGQEVGLW